MSTVTATERFAMRGSSARGRASVLVVSHVRLRAIRLVTASSVALALACGGERISVAPSVPLTPALAIVPGGGDAQTGVVGSTLPLPLVVQLTGVSGSTNGQLLNFVVTSGGGKLFVAAVQTGSPTSGPASGLSGIGQNRWTLGPTVGPQTVEARLVDPKTGQTLTQASFRATAVVGAASTIKAVAGDGQSAVTGALVSVPPAVVVTDQLGNPLPNIAVTFQIVSGGGTITGTNQILTGSNGIAALGGWRLGTTVGSNSLTASAAGLTGSPVTFTATGTVGAASTLAAVAGDGQRAAASTALPLAPSVRVRDANGNGVAGVAVTFTVMTGGGAMDGITSVTTLTNQAGVATVGWSVGASEGANALRATALGLSGSPVTFRATSYAPYYVPNQEANSITVYDPEATGNATPIRTISGANTLLGPPGLPATLARNAAGQLYVTTYQGGAVVVFEAGADGNVSPIRTISGPNTGLSQPYAITIDAAGLIYVSDVPNRLIRIFASNASGNVSPVRSIAGANTGITAVTGMQVSSTGDLYAADQDAGNIKVFAAGASGDVAPIRVISGPSTGLVAAGAVEVDAVGQLYVANFRSASVNVYAVGANGDVAPIRSIGGPSTGLSFPTGLRFDSAGRLFVANYYGQSVTVYAPGATGDAAPIRTVTGPATGLNLAGWLSF